MIRILTKTSIEDVYSLQEQSKRAYFRLLNEVIEKSDIILEVLDARDPLNCRSKEIESKISGQNKKLILILNKCDLIPLENVQKWASYLKREYPTIIFKANTQKEIGGRTDISLHAMNNLTFEKKKEMVETMLGSQKSVGGDNLLQLLKNYCRKDDIKTSVIVGVIGYPNVGKSSLINSLKRTHATAVSNVPGLTKSIQEVHLDKDIRLLDCPGIVFTKECSGSLILRNVIKVEDLDDPYTPIDLLIKKVPKDNLVKLYQISTFNTTQEFLALVARKRGKLMKGGIPDYDKAAKVVLHDWNNGKITYHTEPPEEAMTN
jgi:nuclear GTP-binding protein